MGLLDNLITLNQGNNSNNDNHEEPGTPPPDGHTEETQKKEPKTFSYSTAFNERFGVKS